jgi:hypothetical protein
MDELCRSICDALQQPGPASGTGRGIRTTPVQLHHLHDTAALHFLNLDDIKKILKYVSVMYPHHVPKVNFQQKKDTLIAILATAMFLISEEIQAGKKGNSADGRCCGGNDVHPSSKARATTSARTNNHRTSPSSSQFTNRTADPSTGPPISSVLMQSKVGANVGSKRPKSHTSRPHKLSRRDDKDDFEYFDHLLTSGDHDRLHARHEDEDENEEDDGYVLGRSDRNNQGDLHAQQHLTQKQSQQHQQLHKVSSTVATNFLSPQLQSIVNTPQKWRIYHEVRAMPGVQQHEILEELMNLPVEEANNITGDEVLMRIVCKREVWCCAGVVDH